MCASFEVNMLVLFRVARTAAAERVVCVSGQGSQSVQEIRLGMSSSLHDAALAGDVPHLMKLLDDGADVNSANEYDSTPLLYAAKANSLQAAALLIERGARVNSRNNAKTTALHCAASSGHIAMCELLIRHGADIRAQDEDLDSPLDVAKEEGQHDTCKYLEKMRLQMAEGEIRDAMASGDARRITVAVDRAEDEEVVDAALIGKAKDRISTLRKPPAQQAAEARVAEELAEAKKALAAAQAAAANSTRRMLLAAAAGAVLAVGLAAVLGSRRR